MICFSTLKAPSRAYMKTEEAILSFNIPMEPHQNVLEIGSAPGGSVYNLLNRGTTIIKDSSYYF